MRLHVLGKTVARAPVEQHTATYPAGASDDRGQHGTAHQTIRFLGIACGQLFLPTRERVTQRIHCMNTGPEDDDKEETSHTKTGKIRR